METRAPIVRIDHYQQEANKTCAPLTPEQQVRLAECRDAIGFMVDQARPALMLADALKKYIYYGRPPETNIPRMIVNPDTSVPRTQEDVDLIHAILGLLSEGEEFLSPLKQLSRNTPMTVDERLVFLLNLKEEFGDTPWYLALGARGLHTPLDEIFDANIRKLNDGTKGRFAGGVYSDDAANNRDTTAEAELLQGNGSIALQVEAEKHANPEAFEQAE